MTLKKIYPAIAGTLILSSLYLSSINNYLLFHSLIEMFSITVACGIFMIAWNTRRFPDNDYLLFLGIAYLFIGGLDLIHTLAYKGMNIFHGGTSDSATQLWLAARYMESLSLMIAPSFIDRPIKRLPVLYTYAAVTTLFLAAIFHWHVFPACFATETGLTPFKKLSEYVICFILLTAMARLFRKRKAFDASVFKVIMAAIITTIGAELAFTFYVSVYGFSNLAGHFLKLVSFYLIYKALIETGLKRPYDLLFRDLLQAREALQQSHDKLEIEVRGRTADLITANDLLKNKIEENRQTEKALRESEKRYRTLVENAGIGICLISPEMRVLTLNRQMRSWFPKVDAAQQPFCHSVFHTPPRGDICEGCPTQQTLRDGRRHEAVIETPTEQGIKFFKIISSALRDTKGNVVSAIETIDDITGKKELQKQLIRSERLAATGQLAASIAHEINSPLQGIISLLNVIQSTHQTDSALLKNITLVKGAVNDIRNTVKHLLDLNRPAKAEKQPLNINTIIKQTTALISSHLKKKGIRVDLNLSADLPEIVASPQQLNQLFMNLINNAVEAMTDATQKKTGTAGDKKVIISSHLEKERIIIEIADTGPGIAREDLHHIFDPFYTRKKTAGMGVGLSICNSIVEYHQGTITARNSSGNGAVFTVTLPALRE